MLASWGTFWPTFACSQPFLNIWLGPIFPPRATERYPWEFGETMAETLVSSTSPCYFLSQLFSLLVRSPLPPGCSQRRPEYPLQMKMMFLTSLISREVREKICIIGRIVSPLFSIFYRIFRPKLSSRLFRPPKRKKTLATFCRRGKTRGSPLQFFSGVSFFVRRKSERGNSRAQFEKMGTSEISDHTRLKCAMAVSTTGLRLISFSPFFTRSWRRRELSASGACMLFEVTNNRRFGSLHSIPPPSLLESEFHMHIRFHIFCRGLFGGGKMNSLHCSSYAEL